LYDPGEAWFVALAGDTVEDFLALPVEDDLPVDVELAQSIRCG
jgi:hypothetical protein